MGACRCATARPHIRSASTAADRAIVRDLHAVEAELLGDLAQRAIGGLSVAVSIACRVTAQESRFGRPGVIGQQRGQSSQGLRAHAAA